MDTNGDVLERKSHQLLDERIANILKSANVEVDEETASQLPTWATVVEMYGEEPIIYGLETCEPYRQSVKPEDRMTGPAGIFNTGFVLIVDFWHPDLTEAEREALEYIYDFRTKFEQGKIKYIPKMPTGFFETLNMYSAWGGAYTEEKTEKRESTQDDNLGGFRLGGR